MWYIPTVIEKVQIISEMSMIFCTGIFFGAFTEYYLGWFEKTENLVRRLFRGEFKKIR